MSRCNLHLLHKILAFDHENGSIHIVALYPKAEAALAYEVALWISKNERDIRRIEAAPSTTPSSPNAKALRFSSSFVRGEPGT